MADWKVKTFQSAFFYFGATDMLRLWRIVLKFN